MKITINFKHKKKNGTGQGTGYGTGQGHLGDTNNNDNNILYLNLLKKNKERMRAIKYWGEKIKIINELKEDNDYLSLTTEEQENIVNELLTS